MDAMTGRERAIRAMNFEATDRLPIMANMLPARFVQKITDTPEDDYWRDEQSQMDAHIRSMKIMGMDFHIQNWLPIREEPERHWSRGQFDGWRDVTLVAQDLEIETDRAARLAQELSEDRGARGRRVQEICDFQENMQNRLGDDLLWVFGMDCNGPHIISFSYGEYGYEGFFLACGLYPEILERYWAAHSDLACWHNECIVEAAQRLGWPRIGYLGTDMTDQRGNMVSPSFMARYYFPHLDHAIAPLVAAGFKLVWHSDGNMNDMLNPLIDIGIAGFQGFQEECGTRITDVAKLRNRGGDPLILWGSISVIEVVRWGSFEDIRREVQRAIGEWPHPGLCLGTSSYISPDVPHDSIVELFCLMRTLGMVQRSL